MTDRPAPSVSVVGDDRLAERLAAAGCPVVPTAGGVVVVAGPVGDRAAAAAAAASTGAHPFVLWPPGHSPADADALAARAEEAGVEVGVERPALSRPAASLGGWTARLVSLSVPGPPSGVLDAGGAVGGALDLVLALVGRGAVARLDAAAERDGTQLTAFAASLRFRSGAYAQVWVGGDGPVALYASRPGSRVEATTLDVPLTVVGAPTPPAPPVDALADKVAAFADAVRAGRRPEYGVDAALGTLRLVERVHAHLR